MARKFLIATCGAALLTSCTVQGDSAAVSKTQAAVAPIARASAFAITEVASFDEPWAMTFLPDGRLLISEKKGALKLLAPGGTVGQVTGVPVVDYGGQGGLGDVVLHPKFASNRLIYLSYAEKGEGATRGAVVARGKLTLDDQGGGALSDMKVIWRQLPKVDGGGHFGHRIVFGSDGKLWISSGASAGQQPWKDPPAPG